MQSDREQKGWYPVEKGRRVITFDIRVKTPKGVLWRAYIKRHESDGEVAAVISDNKLDKQPIESVQEELPPAIKMNIEQANAILGHTSKEATWQTAVVLGMLITRAHSIFASPVPLPKAKQKILNNESEGAKADKFSGQVYHDIGTVKKSDEDKSLSRKTVWHILAKETGNFKQSTFFT